MIQANQVLTEANQANQATNAALAQRLQSVEQGLLSTPMGPSSVRQDRLSPQAPASALVNRTELSESQPSFLPKRLRTHKSPPKSTCSEPTPFSLHELQQGDSDSWRLFNGKITILTMKQCWIRRPYEQDGNIWRLNLRRLSSPLQKMIRMMIRVTCPIRLG